MTSPRAARALAALAAAPALLLASCSGGATAPKAAPTTQTTAAVPSSTSEAPPTGGATTQPSTTASEPAGPCGFMAPGQPRYSHVVWIWMENHSYGSVIGSASAPFENQVARECGLATNYHNVTHPSLPNYIAATSGLPASQLGVEKSDCDPSPSCSLGPGVASIFSQAPTWKGYAESMPTDRKSVV